MSRPKSVHWTDAMKARLSALRRGGATYDEISADMGLTRWGIIEQLRRMPRTVKPEPLPVVKTKARDPEPLPPGHPDTWGMLTADTVLDGEPFPPPESVR